jgi:hypothetical protein
MRPREPERDEFGQERHAVRAEDVGGDVSWITPEYPASFARRARWATAAEFNGMPGSATPGEVPVGGFLSSSTGLRPEMAMSRRAVCSRGVVGAGSAR